MAEAGDVILSGATILAEASEVIVETVLLDQERTTVFKSIGMAVEDMATARLVYDLHIAKMYAGQCEFATQPPERIRCDLSVVISESNHLTPSNVSQLSPRERDLTL